VTSVSLALRGNQLKTSDINKTHWPRQEFPKSAKKHGVCQVIWGRTRESLFTCSLRLSAWPISQSVTPILNHAEIVGDWDRGCPAKPGSLKEGRRLPPQASTAMFEKGPNTG
jgi:hypothetical protein